ncbi:MAG: type IV pilus modification protein PilV [Steroidobacteraceae bacterium]
MKRKRTGGFTLVETLVALMALSIGLLGIAAMQMTSLRANLGASWRTQANFLAYDIIDRIRANRTNRASYATAIGDAAPGGGSTANLDLTSWKDNLAAAMPGGDGSVVVNGTTITVTIQWLDSKGDRDYTGADQTATFVTQSQI